MDDTGNTGQDRVNVLVVDDVDANLIAVRRLLQRLPVQVVTCSGGEEAMRAVHDHEFALVLLDVHMPGIGGIDLARMIGQVPSMHGAPIMFLTASSPGEEEMFRGYEAGAIDFINKPVDPTVLLSKVDGFLRLHRQKRALGRLNEALALTNAQLETEIMRRQAVEAELRLHEEHLNALVEQRTAALARSNRELAEFAYVASHDLKGPVRTMANFAGVLVEDLSVGAYDDAADCAARIEGAAQRMTGLIDAVLALSISTEPPAELACIDLGEVMGDALADLNGALQEAGAGVRVGSLPNVRGDALLLHRLILNLLSNALKFRAHDRPLQIGVDAVPENGRWRITVQDNGIGFEAAHAQRIFQPFARLHEPGAFGGTGIGLSVCKRIVERLGGEIRAESGPDVGARFSFTLPDPAGRVARE